MQSAFCFVLACASLTLQLNSSFGLVQADIAGEGETLDL
jgi:hypothetical protein